MTTGSRNDHRSFKSTHQHQPQNWFNNRTHPTTGTRPTSGPSLQPISATTTNEKFKSKFSNVTSHHIASCCLFSIVQNLRAKQNSVLSAILLCCAFCSCTIVAQMKPKLSFQQQHCQWPGFCVRARKNSESTVSHAISGSPSKQIA